MAFCPKRSANLRRGSLLCSICGFYAIFFFYCYCGHLWTPSVKPILASPLSTCLKLCQILTSMPANSLQFNEKTSIKYHLASRRAHSSPCPQSNSPNERRSLSFKQVPSLGIDAVEDYLWILDGSYLWLCYLRLPLDVGPPSGVYSHSRMD